MAGGIFNVTGNRGTVQVPFSICTKPPLYLVQLGLAFSYTESSWLLVLVLADSQGTRQPLSGARQCGQALSHGAAGPRQWPSGREGRLFTKVFVHALSPDPGQGWAHLSIPPGSGAAPSSWCRRCWMGCACALGAHRGERGRRKCAVFGGWTWHGRGAVAAVAAGVRFGTGGSNWASTTWRTDWRTDWSTRCRAPTGLLQPLSGRRTPQAMPPATLPSPSPKAAAWRPLSRFFSFLQDWWLKFLWGCIFPANCCFSKASC